jgi:adenosine deaminase
LLRAGVSLSISTDTRTITNVTLEQEYARLREHFNWSDEEFVASNRAALHAAFIDEPLRTRLLARLATI